jgi:hypothetical protein
LKLTHKKIGEMKAVTKKVSNVHGIAIYYKTNTIVVSHLESAKTGAITLIKPIGIFFFDFLYIIYYLVIKCLGEITKLANVVSIGVTDHWWSEIALDQQTGNIFFANHHKVSMITQTGM